LHKPLIDAKQVMEDIRSGMDDLALMEKYNLSQRGLESLVKKLADAGIVREISAKELLRDVRSGMTNKELMKKYKLSAKALKKIFGEMTDAGIAFFADRRDAREKKRIQTSRILADIRARLSEAQIMNKYELSSRGLQSTFWKLVRSGSLTWDELLHVYPALDDSVTLQKMRQWTRSHPILSISIYEEGNPENRGKVRDLTENGVGVTGMSVLPDEQKKLVMVPDEFMELEPFSLEAICRWSSPGCEGETCSAGFEIVYMDEKSLEELQELVQLMTLTFQ
jgi:uncharacterized protein (DUF433 family)